MATKRQIGSARFGSDTASFKRSLQTLIQKGKAVRKLRKEAKTLKGTPKGSKPRVAIAQQIKGARAARKKQRGIHMRVAEVTRR